ALLVHNRFEDDPRVSRQARTLEAMGVRPAVLCAGVPAGAEGWRWGARVGGVDLFERAAQLTVLGRLRRRVRAVQAKRRSLARKIGEKTPESAKYRAESTAPEEPTLREGRGAAADLWHFVRFLYGNLAVIRQFRGVGARIIHANDLDVLPAAYLLARAWHAVLVYDSHELWVEQDLPWSPFYRRLLGMMEGLLIRKASAVVTVNGAIAGELARRYKVARPVVVMNCPEAPSLAAVDTHRDSDPSLPLQVIYQGLLSPNRGLEQLVDAVAEAPGIMLTLRGPGILRGPLQDRIDRLGLGEQVRLLPPVPMVDLVPALAGFSVGVVPILPVGKSYELCSPNKLFEYMCAGLAVICSDLPVMREVVGEAESGLLVPPGDVAAMARTLSRFAADRPLLLRLRENALRAARDRFNAEHEQAKLRALYERLLDDDSGAGVRRGRERRSNSVRHSWGHRP
ncbi:MAG: glycosyltransferase, partial [Chloroflexota bacterium]